VAQRLIADGLVRVNRHRARKGDVVKDGDIVAVPEELFAPAALQPNPDLVMRVLYEDASVIAVDKPAGTPSHALRAHEMNTVANFLLAHYPELRGMSSGALEPGLVHRLDTDTSGVLVAARTDAAFRDLRQQFRTHRVHKDYAALVVGDVRTAGELCTAIGHAPHNRRKMRVVSRPGPGARAAETIFRPLERFGAYTLLTVRIRTGVMHQIRVHLASVGHPVVGDRVYGAPTSSIAPARHLLHATQIGFSHPVSGALLEITSPLAPEFADVLSELRRGTKPIDD
jgi:23S rRNA pseudouridine1911/1915/1917 synthase